MGLEGPGAQMPKSLEVCVSAETHLSRCLPYARFRIVGISFFEEVVLALKRNTLHEIKGVRRAKDLRISKLNH